jgi:cell division protease FtsH
MSELGVQTLGRPVGMRFLDTPVALGEDRNYSDETARAIDAEVRRILESELARARTILARRKAALQEIAERLLQTETMDRSELERIASGETALREPASLH